MQVEVTNQSKEALSRVLIGLAVAPANSACPSSYAETHTLQVSLSPGEARSYTIDFLDAALSKRPVCIKVIDVEFTNAVSNPTPAAPAAEINPTVCVPDPSKRAGVICRPM
jgi:hypothetical protein